MHLSLVWKTVSFERKTESSAPLARLKEPWTSERIPPELPVVSPQSHFATSRFAAQSLRINLEKIQKTLTFLSQFFFFLQPLVRDI